MSLVKIGQKKWKKDFGKNLVIRIFSLNSKNRDFNIVKGGQLRWFRTLYIAIL